MAMITVNILWNQKKFCSLRRDRKEIRNEIVQRVSEKCALHKISGYTLMRFSKNLNMFTTTELKVILDGDIINVVTETGDEKEPEDEHLLAMKKIAKGNEGGFKKQLLEKIQGNGFFNDVDRKFMSHYFKYHENCGQNESPACKIEVDKSEHEVSNPSDVKQSINDESPKNNRKRSLSGNGEMKEPSKKQKTANVYVQCAKKTVDVGTQSERVVNDYSDVQKYLNLYPELPEEKKDRKKFSKFFDMLFPERRAFVINQEPKAETLREIYPYIFSYKPMVREFELIIETDEIYKKFRQNAKKYCTSVLALAPKNRRSKMIKEKIKEASGDEALRLKVDGSLLLLPMYMGERLKDVVICKDENPKPDRSHPYIRSTSNVDNLLTETTRLSIMMEGVEVCRPHSLLQAFLALVAVHYVFNAEYYPDCEKTCNVLEQLYVGHTDAHSEIDDIKERIEKLEKALETFSS